jgi:hypothetical protein
MAMAGGQESDQLRFRHCYARPPQVAIEHNPNEIVTEVDRTQATSVIISIHPPLAYS